MEKAMYLVDETGLAQYNTLKEKGFYNNIMGTSAVFSIFCDSIKLSTRRRWSSLLRKAKDRAKEQYSDA